MKDYAARVEKIQSTMVLDNHVGGKDTRFSTMEGLLEKHPLVKWLGVIIIGTYQEVSEDSRWAYEPVSDLWPFIKLASDSSDNGSSHEGSKDQENTDYQ